MWRQGLPCVGLVVLLGSLTFIIAPDPEFMPGAHGITRGAPLNGPPTVVLDPGHGGIDDGTKYYGLAEKDMTLDVAGRVQQLLNHAHVANVLTRTSDVYVSLPRRVEIANRLADSNSNVIYVSIHFNQSAVESVDGIETYYADQKIPPPTDWTWIGFFSHPEDEHLDLGENLAADVQSALVSQMQTANRGIKSRSLYVVRHTRMPAVLVEGGFLSNKLENQALRNDSYRDRIAKGIATGILAYIQTMHTAPPPAPSRLANGPAAPREL
jgi:N-acetylmuramoyl-L-alanine amidase